MKLQLDYVARLSVLTTAFSYNSIVDGRADSDLAATPRELEILRENLRQRFQLANLSTFTHSRCLMTIPLSTRGHSFRTFYRRFTKFAFDTRSFGLIHCCPRLRTRRHTKTWRGGTSLSFHARRSTHRDRGRDQESAGEREQDVSSRQQSKRKFRFSANTKKKNSARIAGGGARAAPCTRVVAERTHERSRGQFGPHNNNKVFVKAAFTSIAQRHTHTHAYNDTPCTRTLEGHTHIRTHTRTTLAGYTHDAYTETLDTRTHAVSARI